MSDISIIGQEKSKVNFADFSLETMIDRIICKPVILDTAVSEGGIVMPDRAQNQFLVVQAIKLGPDVKKVKVGDIIYPNPPLAFMLVVDGVQYCICREAEVIVHLRQIDATEKPKPQDEVH